MTFPFLLTTQPLNNTYLAHHADDHSDTLNSQTANPYPDIPQFVLDAILITSKRNRIHNSESADFPSQQAPMQFTDTHNNINDQCLSTQESNQHVFSTYPNPALSSMHTWDTTNFSPQKSDNHPPMTFMESDHFIPAGTDFNSKLDFQSGIGNKRRLHEIEEYRETILEFNLNDNYLNSIKKNRNKETNEEIDNVNMNVNDSASNKEHSKMKNIDENDTTNRIATTTEIKNVQNIDNYHNEDVDDSNVYNVENKEEINNSHSTIIGNTTSNQNIPKKRNNSGNRKRHDRKKKERNRIQNLQYKQSRAMEKK